MIKRKTAGPICLRSETNVTTLRNPLNQLFHEDIPPGGALNSNRQKDKLGLKAIYASFPKIVK